jgi:hypothetical protein
MKRHMGAVHKIKAKNHKTSSLWKDCKLQTYFTEEGRIDYFVVVEHQKTTSRSRHAQGSNLFTETEKDLFTNWKRITKA